MFGHQRGAFSGAFSNRKGLFQSAQHGTLFLDDVNDLPFNLQPKLLDVIQRGSVRPVGSDREVPVDVRIIAACNQPLAPLVRERRFRADLFHRLNVVKLSLLPLRGRTDDLAGLVLGLAKRYPSLYSPIEQVDPQLVQLLATNPFLGNVRELENVIQRAIIVASDETICEKDLPLNIQSESVVNIGDYQPANSFERQLRNYKVKLATEAVREHHGNKTVAARSLNISRAYLHRLLRLAEQDPLIEQEGLDMETA